MSTSIRFNHANFDAFKSCQLRYVLVVSTSIRFNCIIVDMINCFNYVNLPVHILSTYGEYCKRLFWKYGHVLYYCNFFTRKYFKIAFIFGLSFLMFLCCFYLMF